MLLLFGLALILNVNTAAATDHTTPTITSVNPANHTVVTKSQTVKVQYSESIIKTGTTWVDLKNSGGTVVPTQKTTSGNTLFIIPRSALAMGKYNVVIHTGSIQDLAGNKNAVSSTSFTVSPITLAQMKDGISRAQAFYAKNGRLPYTVSYGSNLIKIAEFQKIIATQRLVIKKPKVTAAAVSLSSLDAIMKAASKFRYSGAASTGAAMERIGSGDCWAMSDYLYTHMTKAGMTARIIQYATSMSSRHRSVQYESNGAWVNAPYRTYFSTNMFNNTLSSGSVIACNA